jgi:hypothetical protein
MRLARFEALLDAQGSRLDCWPPPERATAEALLAADAGARRLHAAALAVDELLPSLMAPEPAPAGLSRRLAEIPLRAAPARAWWDPFTPISHRWLAGGFATLAAAALLGFWLGATSFEPADLDEGEPTLTILAFGFDLDVGDP